MQQREFRRQLAAVVRRHERVDAGDIRVDLSPGAVRQCGPCRPGGATEADRAKEAILRHRHAAEDLGQPAMTDAPLEFHLPQPVLGVHVAEAVERVGFRGREDVRDGVGVAHDLDRRRQTGDGQRAVDERQR